MEPLRKEPLPQRPLLYTPAKLVSLYAPYNTRKGNSAPLSRVYEFLASACSTTMSDSSGPLDLAS